MTRFTRTVNRSLPATYDSVSVRKGVGVEADPGRRGIARGLLNVVGGEVEARGAESERASVVLVPAAATAARERAERQGRADTPDGVSGALPLRFIEASLPMRAPHSRSEEGADGAMAGRARIPEPAGRWMHTGSPTGAARGCAASMYPQRSFVCQPECGWLPQKLQGIEGI